MHFNLSHDQEKAILEREMDNAIRNVQEDVENAFPDGLPMMEKPAEPEVRFQRYKMLTMPQDLPLIAMDNYITEFKKGMLPPLVSPFWQHLVLFPDLFSEMRKDFMKVSGQVQGEE